MEQPVIIRTYSEPADPAIVKLVAEAVQDVCIRPEVVGATVTKVQIGEAWLYQDDLTRVVKESRCGSTARLRLQHISSLCLGLDPWRGEPMSAVEAASLIEFHVEKDEGWAQRWGRVAVPGLRLITAMKTASVGVPVDALLKVYGITMEEAERVADRNSSRRLRETFLVERDRMMVAVACAGYTTGGAVFSSAFHLHTSESCGPRFAVSLLSNAYAVAYPSDQWSERDVIERHELAVASFGGDVLCRDLLLSTWDGISAYPLDAVGV